MKLSSTRSLILFICAIGVVGVIGTYLDVSKPARGSRSLSAAKQVASEKDPEQAPTVELTPEERLEWAYVRVRAKLSDPLNARFSRVRFSPRFDTVICGHVAAEDGRGRLGSFRFAVAEDSVYIETQLEERIMDVWWATYCAR